MKIIPAIDLINGKCVRLTKGDYGQKKIYNENPLEVAKEFEANGIKQLHLVDLDGAKQGHIKNHTVLEQIATQTKLFIDFGGGVKTDDDIKLAFNSGAKMVTGGSIAVKNEALFRDWLNRYGSEKLILGADVINEKIAISGWQESSDLSLIPFLEKYTQAGIKYSICTDVDKDGMLQGTSIELYKKIAQNFPELKLIASGGVTTINDLNELKKINVHGVIIGKAIYEGKITLNDLKPFL